MKKTMFVLTAIIFMFLVKANGQVSIGPKLSLIGLKNTYEDPQYREEYKPQLNYGLDAGVAAQLQASKKISIISELLYSVKKVSVKKQKYDPSVIRYTNHYIHVPLLLQLDIGHGQIKGYFTFGPDINYWLGGNLLMELYDGNRTINDEFKYHIIYKNKDDRKKFFVKGANRLQLGLQMGGGLILPVNRISKIKLDIRYGAIHTHLSKLENPGIFDPALASNFKYGIRYINLNASYMIKVNDILKAMR